MMRIGKIIKLLLFFLVIFLSSQSLHAQDLLKGKDLSQIKVDQLSDADILKLKAQLNNAGQTIEQTEQAALAKGMPATEFVKLKQRINALANKNESGGKLKSPNDRDQTGRINNSSDTLNEGKYKEAPPKPLINPLIFGSELYTSTSPSFEPNLKLATPLNYILGPDDQIQISVYGVQEYTGEFLVSPEGNISIPNVGQIKVAGLTIEDATEKIKTLMGNSAYIYLKSGGAKLSVTLSKIRSIKVTIIGSNFPGDFTVSSLSTVFNALYLSGGPTAFGSFREIELVRNNKIIRKIDLYHLLIRGDQSDNVGLKDHDVIIIPAYKKRVELQGQVKRPGIFEVLPGENFDQVLNFASNFTDTAYKAVIKVFQRSETERRVHDLPAANFGTYQPESGDVFVISKILNRFQNRVTISGSVFRPDIYELTNGMKVSDLIRRADGLKEDAYVSRGQIIRLEEDSRRSILSFNIRKALQNDPNENVLLQREDEILISSILDLRDSFKVTIQGEIRIPGQYEFVNNLTLKDLIQQAGGFTDAAYKNIEIARLIKRDSISASDTRASSIIHTEIDPDKVSQINDVALQPFDVITIRRKAGYTLPESVLVSGQVQYPGPYALSERSERVSDILKRAGGYTPDANPAGAFLKRYKTDYETQKALETAKKLQKVRQEKQTSTTPDITKQNATDSIGAVEEEIKRDYDQIPLDLPSILSNPGSIEDIILRSKDELYIPKFDGQVRVSGAVLLATQVPYQKGNNLRDYIAEAGGFSGNAWRRKAYVVYANGKAATTSHFLFFKTYPKILPGSELVVPELPAKKQTSIGESIGIASALASLAGVVIAILKL
jgi:protein involved in polysaccharide export with SLBB domain